MVRTIADNELQFEHTQSIFGFLTNDNVFRGVSLRKQWPNSAGYGLSPE